VKEVVAPTKDTRREDPQHHEDVSDAGDPGTAHSATRIMSAWLAVRDEVAEVLSAVSDQQMHAAADLLVHRGRRWFCSGQGRSGLVAQMFAMRLMHAGFQAHAVGEATAPSIGRDDGLVVISHSGETPVTIYQARLALESGARVLALTRNVSCTLASLAETVVEVPTAVSRQFSGSLFEQSALLLLDALVLEITADDPHAHAAMNARHTNLQ
jgi:6-phospho-3-hexuloisomerase